MIDTDKMRELWRHVELSALLEMAQGDIFDLCDELDRTRVERQWRPIETAPRDGTRVLIARDTILHGRIVREAWWRQPWDGAPDVACWWGYAGGKTALDMHIHGIGATFWQPLPEAPSDE